MYNTLELHQDARGVTTLWLNRAEKHNALSGELIEELTRAAEALRRDDSVRVVILAGRGKSFCAGGDLGWMRTQINATSEARASEARKLAMMLQAFNTLPKPVIARVHGNAYGGGVGMMSVCDLAVGADHVQMSLTETRLGLIPATIGPYVCARMGEAQARQVFMSGARMDADRAVHLGLLSRAVPAAELDDAVEAEVVPYLSCAPGAVARSKALLRSLGPVIDETVIESSVAALVATWEDPEATEGISAFFDKRPAPWVGS